MSDELGIGVLGAGWITRAHGHALQTIGHMAPLARSVRLVALGARNAERGQALADELGFGRFTTDWRSVVEDPDVDVVANLLGQSAHLEGTEAALALGKPVLCEKPLGVDRFEARRLADAASRAGVPAVCGFNYRYMPAMRLARELIEAGRLGDPIHFRAVYLQDHAAGAEPSRPHNGSRAITDYAHIVDFLRYLGCEAEAVQASMKKLTSFGPDVEDAYVAAVDLAGGGLASLEVSRVARGWKGRQVVEFNGTTGSLWWDMEDLNHLHVFDSADEADRTGGFRNILVSQPDHPFMDLWWPPGHAVGWEHSFVHEWRDFLSAVIEGRPISPEQATFEDGYEAALICDAIALSSNEGRRVRLDELRVPPAAGG